MKNRTKKVYRRYRRLAKQNMRGGKKSRIKKAGEAIKKTGEAIKETGEAVYHSNLVGVAVDPLKTLGKGLVGYNKKMCLSIINGYFDFLYYFQRKKLLN